MVQRVPDRTRGGRRRGRPRQRTDLSRRLAEAEARYFALVEALPLVTYVGALDVQGSFSYISPQVEALLGFKPEEWLANPRLWLQRLHPGDRARLLPMLARAHRDERPFRADYRLRDRTGRARWVRDESHVVRDPAGNPLFVQGTWTDITGAKDLERAATGKGHELLSAREQLERFTSAASHELAAPLRRIGNLSELLTRRAGEGLDGESRRLLDRIRESAARLQRLVAGLVEYWEQGQPPDDATANLETVLDEALAELAASIAATGAVVSRRPLPRARADSRSVRRVLVNLLDNALKFSGGQRPQVSIWAERSGEDWVISVRDNGIGLGPREASRVFSLFDPGQPRRPAEGLRLSLPLCKKIVAALGGRIWVESEPGEGSTFRFTLPAAPEESGP